MPRKGKLEPSDRRHSPTDKYSRWRVSVEALLRQRWLDSPETKSVAATVIGMFDAGAKDSEVAAYLRSQEVALASQVSLSDSDRSALVSELHKSAGADISLRPSNEEL